MTMCASMQSTAVDRIEVAVGLVFDESGRVLLGQRTENSRYRGKWEFPGGKVKLNESRQMALQRELHEEVGIQVIDSSHLMSFAHDYPDRRVMLNFYVVVQYAGEPQPRENQPLQWVSPESLNSYELLDANRVIVERLQQGGIP